MKTFEKIFWIIFVIGIIFKLKLWPFGATFITISLFPLYFFYLFFGFAFFNKIKLRNIFKKDSYKEISVLRIIGSIGAGIGLSAICIGILFKLMFWPEGDLRLYAGLIPTFTIAIIALVKFFRSKSDFYKPILLRITIIGALGLPLCFVSDLEIVKFEYRNYPDYVKAYEIYLEDPQNEEANKQLEKAYNRVRLGEEYEMFMQDYK